MGSIATNLSIPGNYQHLAGCAADWDPACGATQLTYDAKSDVWKGTFTIGTAGNYQYKVAINNSWTENYSLNSKPGKAGIPLSMAVAGPVKFYYDHKSHWVADNKDYIIANVPGDFQQLLGCPSNWDPSCFRSWLEDPSGSGTYSFSTTALPAGTYQAKVALNESWTVNYGAEGVPGGANILFFVAQNSRRVNFSYNPTNHILTIAASPTPVLVPADLASILVSTILLTFTAVLLLFALSGGWRQKWQLFVAAAFSATGAIRMIVELAIVRATAGALRWQPYADSILSYIVPTVGWGLLSIAYSRRFRWLNDALLVLFVLLGAFAIPYEVVTHEPGRFLGVENALLVALIVVWLANLIWASPTHSELGPLRISSAIFALFVANEHWRWVRHPWGINLEPIGFLVFMGTIVFDLIRMSIRDQARLIAVDSELSTAREMQRAVIPEKPPEVTGLDIATVYRPSSAVGGDFFDFLVDGQNLSIFIADVSGHGVPAALVASMLKIALATHDCAASPAAVLHQLNRLFVGRLRRQFFTAAFVRIDLAAYTMTVSSGGHPPTLILPPAADRASEIEARGFLLGRMADASFNEVTVPFTPGTIAAMYTDGIIEAADARGEIWGYDRLARCIELNRNAGASTIAETIVIDVENWSARSRADADDLTLVIVKAT